MHAWATGDWVTSGPSGQVVAHLIIESESASRNASGRACGAHRSPKKTSRRPTRRHGEEEPHLHPLWCRGQASTSRGRGCTRSRRRIATQMFFGYSPCSLVGSLGAARAGRAAEGCKEQWVPHDGPRAESTAGRRGGLREREFDYAAMRTERRDAISTAVQCRDKTRSVMSRRHEGKPSGGFRGWGYNVYMDLGRRARDLVLRLRTGCSTRPNTT